MPELPFERARPIQFDWLRAAIRLCDQDGYRDGPENPTKSEFQDSMDSRMLHTKFLKKLMDENRCLWIFTHGMVADRNAWLLVQHSDTDPEFQGRVARLLLEAFRRGDAFVARTSRISQIEARSVVRTKAIAHPVSFMEHKRRLSRIVAISRGR